jgi:hypothetical protein
MSKLVKESLNEEIDDNGLSLYKISELSAGGESVERLIGVYRATDKLAARQLAAEWEENEDIVKTGFYEVEEVSEEDLWNEKKRLQDELDKLEPKEY